MPIYNSCLYDHCDIFKCIVSCRNKVLITLIIKYRSYNTLQGFLSWVVLFYVMGPSYFFTCVDPVYSVCFERLERLGSPPAFDHYVT